MVTTLADEDSVVFLREQFAPEMVTALGRIDGRAVGFIANNSMYMAGAITSAGADKAARFIQLCDAFDLPVVSLVDTPGMMVGPEAEATGLVRHTSRLLVAGAALRVPFVAVVLRRGFGLGAQAMVGGSLHEPLLTVAWPAAELGPMGLEGAIRLGFRKELEAIEDEAERERRVRELLELAEQNAKAVNAATLFELDDVIDPADTRSVISATIAAAEAHPPRPHGSFVDTWSRAVGSLDRSAPEPGTARQLWLHLQPASRARAARPSRCSGAAPRSSASASIRSFVKPENTITRVSGEVCRMIGRASRPSIPGMERSSTTTFG